MPSPHEILGVAATATEAQIKEAYRRLAGKLHPDRTGGDKRAEERMKEVNQAYGDALKSLRSPGLDNEDLEKVFRDTFSEDFFSIFSGLGSTRTRRPQTQKIEIPLSFDESLAGVVKEATMRRWIACDLCSGRKGSSCRQCQGRGQVSSEDRAEFHIPSGVDTGEIVQATSEQGYRMLAQIQVSPSPVWAREGLDLKLVVPIPSQELVAGAKVMAASPFGSVEFSVPEGFYTDQWLSIPGHGVRHPSGVRGRLLVRLAVEVGTTEKRFPRSESYRQWLQNRSVLS